MDAKDFKYNKEQVTFVTNKDILCVGCKNTAPDNGPFEGYLKNTCKGYPDGKPIDVLLGRSMECPKYDEE